MATSEHVIMQNEALVALALIAALELGKYPGSSLCLFSFQSVKEKRAPGRAVKVEQPPPSTCLSEACKSVTAHVIGRQ